jgi:hypothetical protein
VCSKGTVEKAPGDKEKFIITGTIRQIDDTSVEITELPIRKWTEQYKEFLESCMIGGTVPEKDKDKEKPAKAAKVPERFLQVDLTATLHCSTLANRFLLADRTIKNTMLGVTSTLSCLCPRNR